MAIYTWDLPADSDAWPCPEACGGLTEDPAGGPCKRCWDKVAGPLETSADWAGPIHWHDDGAAENAL
jgi:hypothetical protein